MNIVFRSCLITVIILFLFGCSPRTDILLYDGRHVPKEPKFNIRPETSSYDSINIKFNAIYYSEISSIINNRKNVSYSYYRFWPNGRVVKKLVTVFPNEKDVDDLDNSFIGYYMVNDNNLEMEFFMPDSVVNNWVYIKVFGKIYNNKIVTTYSEIRGEKNYYKPVSYFIMKFNNLRTKTDW